MAERPPLTAAVDVAHPALRPLRPSEHRVVELVAQGKTNPEIANALHLAEDTVKAHLRRVFEAWGVSSRHDLTAVAVAGGWAACPYCTCGLSATAPLTAAAESLRALASGLDTTVRRIRGEADGATPAIVRELDDVIRDAHPAGVRHG